MNLQREKQKLILDGQVCSLCDLKAILDCSNEESTSFLQSLYDFLLEWFDDSDNIVVKTSGSTGTPKSLTVSKKKMIQSAKNTCEFLNLQPGDKALLCMSLQFIAGKMMVVRALVGSLDLRWQIPSGNPLKYSDCQIDFAAMVPAQVYNSLQNSIESQRLANIRTLIIGGANIDESLENVLQQLPNQIYSTYGMTETLSHIAMRRLNGENRSLNYYPLPSINISLSAHSTLIINAPLICDEQLQTNDIVSLNSDGSFRFRGRIDNVINSGGIKIQIEEVEQLLKSVITTPFAITSIPHPKWGEEIVLLIESNIDLNEIGHSINEILPKYWQPRHLFKISYLPMTNTNKIDRKNCKILASDLINSSKLN